MNRLQDRLALVTGASAGIGAATARALAAEGAEVLLLARRIDRLEALAAELPRARCLAVDVRDAAALAHALEGEPVDLVVLNAGMARGADPIQVGSAEDSAEVVETNILGVLNTMHATLPAMLERGHGDVVFMGSVAGRWVYPGGAVYCATKHAVRALYEGARQDAAGSGLRFTTIDPGMVQTEFSDVRFRGDDDRVRSVYQGVTPLTPEDVADALLYAVTRPAHVNIGEIVLWASAQASCTVVTRD